MRILVSKVIFLKNCRKLCSVVGRWGNRIFDSVRGDVEIIMLNSAGKMISFLEMTNTSELVSPPCFVFSPFLHPTLNQNLFKIGPRYQPSSWVAIFVSTIWVDHMSPYEPSTQVLVFMITWGPWCFFQLIVLQCKLDKQEDHLEAVDIILLKTVKCEIKMLSAWRWIVTQVRSKLRCEMSFYLQWQRWECWGRGL